MLLSYEDTHPPSDAPALDALISWLSTDPATVVGPVVLREHPSAGRCVFTSSPLPADTPIVRIPRRFLITPDHGRGTSIGRAFAARQRAGALVSAWSGNEEEPPAFHHMYLSIFLCMERGRPDSFFAPYLATLPTSFPSLPLFWNEQDLAELAGSYVLTSRAARLETLAGDYAAVCAAAPGFKSIASLEVWVWARCVVASRVFAVCLDGVATDALVPLADMLNHARPRPARWAYAPVASAFVVTLVSPLPLHVEVCDGYGNKSNARYLSSYGFVMPCNWEVDGTGCCYNDVRVLLSLQAAQGSRASDWLGIKLARLGASSCVLESQLSPHLDSPGTAAAFSFLRFVFACGYEELALLPAVLEDVDWGGAGGDRDGGDVPPLSPACERAVLAELARVTRALLLNYPPPRGDPPPTANAANARLLVEGERQVVAFFAALEAAARPVLEASCTADAQAAAEVWRPTPSSDDWERITIRGYILGVALPLVKKGLRGV